MLLSQLSAADEKIATLTSTLSRLSAAQKKAEDDKKPPSNIHQKKQRGAPSHHRDTHTPVYYHLTKPKDVGPRIRTVQQQQQHCVFLLYLTRKAPPSYCTWKPPQCTFPMLVTGLGGAGTHSVAKMLEQVGIDAPYEQVRENLPRLHSRTAPTSPTHINNNDEQTTTTIAIGRARRRRELALRNQRRGHGYPLPQRAL